ncbi:MAG: GNAT family N-acetyltransferase [Candidatus Micrarchaeota archaeon]|nr:GNAT family N-acetyltransferase [Candidatus Micrarchaeota archaeon]
MFSVRKAKPSDMDAVRQMVSILFPSARLRQLPEDVFLVAEKEGIPIGFCHYRIRKKACYIAGLGVLPQYREHGVGTRLMAEALYRIDRAGVQKTYLKVRALNHAAKLYLGFGFYEKRAGDTITLVRKKPS